MKIDVNFTSKTFFAKAEQVAAKKFLGQVKKDVKSN